MSFVGKIMRTITCISVLIQTIWFEPNLVGYLPTACSYLVSRFTIYSLLICLLPACGIAICIGIWRVRSWAWNMAIILSLFVLLQSGVYLKLGNSLPIALLQVMAGLVCCMGFIVAAMSHEIKRREVLIVIIALIAAIVIVYVRSSYFRTLSIDYEQQIPRWLETWDHSDIVGAKAVFLWWGLFWAITGIDLTISAFVQKHRRVNNFVG
jgi:hypothetical protein